MKNCISIFELVELGVLLGSVTFIIGLVFFLYLLKRIKINYIINFYIRGFIYDRKPEWNT